MAGEDPALHIGALLTRSEDNFTASAIYEVAMSVSGEVG